MKSWIQLLIDCFVKPFHTWQNAPENRKYTIGVIITPIVVCMNLLLFLIGNVFLLGAALLVYHVFIILSAVVVSFLLLFTKDSSIEFLRRLWRTYIALLPKPFIRKSE